MKLTGKAKQDFEKWFNNKCYDSFLEFEDLFSNNKELNIIRNALIIEFFDSLKMWDYAFYVEYCVNQNYKEATEEAIKQCNKIYNNIK